ncbi:MAG: D-alanine--D-alanine ligase [Coriobacteriales bacterium]|nr:D-alanine--D-alanine ligase [Coriobacteriales bacterium]
MKARSGVDKLKELQKIAAAVSDRVTSVALLYGGTSGEREVSIASGNGVKPVLEEEGFAVSFIDTKDPGFIDRLRAEKPDVAFIALHGRGGEDGCIQGLLEVLGIPYTHSGVEASALAMDKQASKILYQASGLSTAGFFLLHRDQFDDNDELIASIELPCVIKPLRDGSSLGVSIPKTHSQLLKALDEGFSIDKTLLVEELIVGVEVTVPVLGNNPADLVALPVIEIVPKNEFYDYESKYAEGGSVHVIPARITEDATAACQQAAIDAHRVLGCAGVSRTDMIISSGGAPCLIETNTIPGMTRTSLIPEDARKFGLSAGELYRLLIHYALES